MKTPMARLRSESGFALLEAVVAAALLAMVALAVLSGLDGASASSGREKARNVAASLAEADQERLRAQSVTSLAAVATTSPYALPDPVGTPVKDTNGVQIATTKAVDGVTYTISSTVQFVADDSGTSASCSTDTDTTQYFHIRSSVTSAVVGTRTAAVTLDSIIAPNVAYSSTVGTLAVQVLDAGGNPVAGKTVRITGGITPPPDKVTNALGCAVWEKVPTVTGGTTYQATLNDPLYVDHFGHSSSTVDAPVLPDKVNRTTMYYDVAKQDTANVYTYAPGSTVASPGAGIASYAFQVSATNTGETGMIRNWPATAGASELSSVPMTSEFPFTTTYTYFTGNCHYNDPTTSTYGNTTPAIAALLAGQQTLAGGAQPVTVYQPPLNASLAKGANGSAPTASLSVDVIPVTPSSDTCVQPTLSFQTFKVGSKWMVGRSYTNNVLEAGAPYGQYDLCFHDKIGSTRYVYSPSTYPNAGTASGAAYYDNTTPPTGQPTTEALPGTGWTKGSTC
jgi:type II secretory pathway pseudopilin PulG